jgi:malate synthase
VGVQYLEAWLKGVGCVPLYNLMEDAATAEISRTQVWQWIRHRATLEDGRVVTRELFGEVLESEVARLREARGTQPYEEARFLREACTLFARLAGSEHYEEFLTLPAYELLLNLESVRADHIR